MTQTNPRGGNRRSYYDATLVIPSGSSATSAALDTRLTAALMVYVPAGFTGDLAFQVSATEDGTFTALYDESNALISITVTAGRWYAVPAKVFAAHFLKLFSHTSGTPGNQGADCVLLILAKA